MNAVRRRYNQKTTEVRDEQDEVEDEMADVSEVEVDQVPKTKYRSPAVRPIRRERERRARYHSLTVSCMAREVCGGPRSSGPP